MPKGGDKNDDKQLIGEKPVPLQSKRIYCLPRFAWRLLWPGLAFAAVWGSGAFMRYGMPELMGDDSLEDVGFWMMVGGAPAHVLSATGMAINDLQPPIGWWRRRNRECKGCCTGCEGCQWRKSADGGEMA